MNVLQSSCIGFDALSLKVNHLSADHPIHRARAFRNLFNNLDACLRRALQSCEYFIGLSLQCIARKNGDRLAENFVARRTSTAQIVIVECRQIVVNKGIRVQHLESGAQFFDSGGQVATDDSAGLHAQDRTDSLAPGKHAVTHCGMNRTWPLLGRWKKTLQRRVRQLAAFFQCFVQHGGEYNKRKTCSITTALGFPRGWCIIAILTRQSMLKITISVWASLATVLLGSLAFAQVPAYDILITNARIVDGTGAPWFVGDIGIRGDRIAAIGNLHDANAEKRIDASGLIASPGFIDVQGQSEFNILVDGRAASKITQGVTTEITGEGTSIAP